MTSTESGHLKTIGKIRKDVSISNLVYLFGFDKIDSY